MLHVHILVATVAEVCLWGIGFRQLEGHVVTLLVGNEVIDALHLRRVDEGTLHTYGLCTVEEEHVTTTNELLGACAVEDSLRVDAGTHLEGDTGGEVSLDITSDDSRRRTLSGNHHVDTHGTCQLGDTGDGQLNLLACGHDQVTELIDDHHDIRHIVVSAARWNLTFYEFLVILLDVSRTHLLQQVVTGIHQLTE